MGSSVEFNEGHADIALKYLRPVRRQEHREIRRAPLRVLPQHVSRVQEDGECLRHHARVLQRGGVAPERDSHDEVGIEDGAGYGIEWSRGGVCFQDKHTTD
jgi:hypothetical protein